ncbi:PGN_0703 family putative restriction endonuclease [Bradyrhizobium sp. AZCC 1721]|uniref:PGN_0703 family putative restriction endonuclease n=1 Tax=Bradyrhizobium sp. AZCC 1721 TaxID=3117016 RepID=UPI002FF3DD5E
MKSHVSTIECHLYTPMTRVPLVPENVLRRHNVHFSIDTRFRRAARLLQYLWLCEQGIPTGIHVQGTADAAITMELGSCLSPEAADAGRNFLSPAIHGLVRRELVMREEGAMIDEDRLFRNALSSMPLVFNLFGPMVIDPRLATSVFRRLLPDFVHTVEGITFEHSPGRHEDRFLADGTAFDLAMRVVTPDGEEATVFFEIKYSEDMAGPAARMRPRYDEASREVRLFKDPQSHRLRALALEQLWREHMLAQLTVDQGITTRALFVAVGPRLNRRVNAAFRIYESELIGEEDRDSTRVGFKALTLEAVIAVLADAGASEIATALWRRYCDFERVYDFALHEFAATNLTSSNNSEGRPGREGDAPKAVGKIANPVPASATGRSKVHPRSSKASRGGAS